MLLRNAHIESALREPPLEFQQAGTAGHGGSNGADLFIPLRQRNHGLAERIGVCYNLCPQLFAGHGVKFSDTVELGRVRLRKGIAPALFRDHMDHHRLPQLPGRGEQGDQIRQVVTVRRPQIGKAHVFKNGGGQEKPLHLVLDSAADRIDGLAAGQSLHDLAVSPFCVQIIVAGAQPGQVAGQAAHISADGHFVVIDDDDHGLPADSGVVQALIGHAAGESAVTDQGNHIVILMLQCPGPGHTQGDGHGAGGVARHKGIRSAFRRLGEAGNAAVLPQTRKIRPAARQQLMHVRLVTNVKHQAVSIRIKHGFDSNAQLHHTQITCQVTAGLGDTVNQKLADIITKLTPLTIIEFQ